MAKSWVLDGRSIARSIKTAGLPSLNRIKDWECPQCGSRIDNDNVANEWPGLPIGVKFDPSDVELLEHLAAKCEVGNEKPHPFIDDFIPTIDEDKGICYQHPENLPGSRKDGNSVHFFYRTTHAYNKGKRKRRKIDNESCLTRWHKTGKTKAIFKKGVQLGSKKIMVLYGTTVGGSKPTKMNWVMHQYHLGTHEDELEGEYVVSKVFYHAQKQADQNTARMTITSPRTPMINVPDPPRLGKSSQYEDVYGDCVSRSPRQESECSEQKISEQKYLPSLSTSQCKDEVKETTWEDDSQAIDLDIFHNSFFSQENSNTSNNYFENLDFESPLDVDLSELYFSSQDSFFDGPSRI